jgi:FAD/FMN-containing dehydrogenase
MLHSASQSDSISQLRSTVAGEVIAPADAGYDRARAVFYTGIDRRPAAVIRPANAADVASTITAAREAGLELAVRSGGHSAAGHGTCDGGLVLDLSSMRALDIDVAGRTAWAETGLTAGDYTRAVGVHGLATGFGDAATVGIGGLTLGGGIGFLHRMHGLTIDNLLAAEVVTADGRLLHADEQTNADLFWAIRGGGGNFGVVTRVRFRLHAVDPVVAGMLILPATPSLIASFLAEAIAAPEELGGMINVMPAPPMPMFPVALHGKPILMAVLLHAGSAEAGERAFAPFRALGTPLVDNIQPMRYVEIYDGPGEPPPAFAMAVRSVYLDTLDEAGAEQLLHRLQTSTAMLSVAQFRVLGGAVRRVAADATAFGHRDRGVLAAIAASYEQPADAAERAAWADSLAGELRQGDGAYVGFLSEVDAAAVRNAYSGSSWDRLREIKARYDPDNLFRRNQNIPPAT